MEQALDSLMTIPKVKDNSEQIDALQRQIDSLKAADS